MNEKITLPTLVGLLADKTGKQKKQCEDFLREFFNTLVDAMETGENVRIKSLGTFKVVAVEPRKSVNVNTGEQMEIPGHNKIVFVPAKELAEEVNAPFAMFESFELPDNVLEETLPSSEISDTTVSEAQTEEEPLPSSEISDMTVPAAQAADFPEPETDSQENEQEYEIGNEYAPESALVPESGMDSITEATEQDEEHPETRRNYRFLLGFACGVACAAVICLCAYLFFFEKWVVSVSGEKKTEVSAQTGTSTPSANADVRQIPEPVVSDSDEKDLIVAADTDSKNEQTAKAEQTAEKGQTAEVPTRPSDEPVYDTITKTRYLTTMAKEHYGNYNLWPYIYEENKAILGHPDRIRPGTKVIVPPLSKYGVNPSDPDDVAKAKKKGVAIYARYQ